jgi:zinc transport system substrate-binding protein
MIPVLKDWYGARVRRVAILFAAVLLAGCGGSEGGGERTVVASFYPLAWATEQVAGQGVEVVNLTPAGAEPHDVELTPSDVEEIRDADLVVYVGAGFQPAVEDAVADREGPALDVLEGADDPHVWLDPLAFSDIVERIAEQAERLGLESGASGAAAFLESSLRGLDVQYRQGLADCERHTLVTTHAAFGQLAARYGLTQLALAGRTPESEPSPRDLERLIAEVRASGATTVFAEPLVSSRVAETVARESGARVATLDPIEGLSQERLDQGEDYVSVMRANLAALRKALGCR